MQLSNVCVFLLCFSGVFTKIMKGQNNTPKDSDKYNPVTATTFTVGCGEKYFLRVDERLIISDNEQAKKKCSHTIQSEEGTSLVFKCRKNNMNKDCNKENIIIEGKKPIKYCSGEVTEYNSKSNSVTFTHNLKLKKDDSGCSSGFLCQVVVKTDKERTYRNIKNIEPKNLNCNCGIENEKKKGPEHPWMALIMTDYFTNEKLCAGVLISPQWVITAAHCVFGEFGNVSVHLGAHNRKKEDAVYNYLVEEKNIFINDQYEGGMDNNLALIKLNQQAPCNANIRPACLQKDLTIKDVTVLVTGWGSLQSEQPEIPVLQKVESEIISNEQCRKKIKDASQLTNKLSCATSKKNQLCQVNDGSPALLKADDKWVVSGLISQTAACSDGAHSPLIEINPYIDWINMIRQDN